MTSKDTGQEDRPQLDRAALGRLDDLLDEISDMHIALGKLLKAGDNEDCPAALIALHDTLDRRLARAIELVATGKEEE